MASISIRQANLSDVREVAALCALLWPDASVDEHQHDASGKIATGKSGTLPSAIFLAQTENGVLVGFIEVGLRSHADGCDPAQPVGFIEGWYVSESFRGKGVGRRLMDAAEAWARENGCIEMASDVLLDNPASQQAHASLGFSVVDRCVHFKKNLRPSKRNQ